MCLIEALFVCILCTSCIFVMVGEMALATVLFLWFYLFLEFLSVLVVGVCYSNCTACMCGVTIVGFCACALHTL